MKRCGQKVKQAFSLFLRRSQAGKPVSRLRGNVTQPVPAVARRGQRTEIVGLRFPGLALPATPSQPGRAVSRSLRMKRSAGRAKGPQPYQAAATPQVGIHRRMRAESPIHLPRLRGDWGRAFSLWLFLPQFRGAQPQAGMGCAVGAQAGGTFGTCSKLMERNVGNVTQPVPAVARRGQRRAVCELRASVIRVPGPARHRHHRLESLCHILLAALLLLLLAARTAVATAPDTFSPVVSYQFLESLDSSPATSPIVSPVVSYQYFDWIGDANVTFRNSADVSYYFSGGVSATLTGVLRDTSGAPVAGATVVLMRYGTVFWQGTTDQSGAFVAANIQATNYTVKVTKSGFRTLRTISRGMRVETEHWRSLLPPCRSLLPRWI